MKKLFSDEFAFANSFYYGSLSKSSKHAIVNLLNPSISYRQQDVLKELYFDLEFRVDNFCPLTTYNYYIIQSPEDVSFLQKNIQSLSTYKTLVFSMFNYEFPLAEFIRVNNLQGKWVGFENQFYAQLCK